MRHTVRRSQFCSLTGALRSIRRGGRSLSEEEKTSEQKRRTMWQTNKIIRFVIIILTKPEQPRICRVAPTWRNVLQYVHISDLIT